MFSFLEQNCLTYLYGPCMVQFYYIFIHKPTLNIKLD